MSIKQEVKMPKQQHCERCGYISSNRLCKACILLEGLNRGLPKLGIGKTPKHYLASYREGSGDAPSTDSCGNCSCRGSEAKAKKADASVEQLTDQLDKVSPISQDTLDF